MPLPDLMPSHGEPEITISFGRVTLPPEARQELRWASADRTTAHVFFRNAGACSVHHGREIVIDRAPDADERIVRLLILGPALAMIAQQRGWLTLHASAVDVDGQAIGFLAPSGGGKSTLAAAFHDAGRAVVDDDLLAIDTGGPVPLAIPGFPRLKLYPDVLTYLGIDPDPLPRLHPDVGKLGRGVKDRFVQRPLPLRAMYILASGEAVEMEAVSEAAALIELIRYAYGVRVLRSPLGPRHFRQCTSVAARVPVKRLRRPATLTALPQMIERIERDLTGG
jgi:hypothetical protein